VTFCRTAFRHQAGGHDLGHGVGRVVLGVFAAAVLVVVLDQVFEERGVEVEFLAKMRSKLKFTSLLMMARAKSSRLEAS
jgi:hypothetical protein